MNQRPKLLAPIRDLYHAVYRYALPLRFWLADRHSTSTGRLPPARLRYRVAETLDSEVFLRTGQSGAERLQNLLREAGYPLEEFRSVLDFGCGCGRTAMWLQDTCQEFWGVDVDEASVSWCEQHLRSGHYKNAGALPPLAFNDGSFDLIYAISVFTHLDFSFQQAWRDELWRLLTPGGTLLFTIHAEHIKSKGSNGTTDDFRFERSRKLQGVLPDWYHTTFQSHESVMATFGKRFADIRWIPRGMGDQDVYLALKADEPTKRCDPAG